MGPELFVFIRPVNSWPSENSIQYSTRWRTGRSSEFWKRTGPEDSERCLIQNDKLGACLDVGRFRADLYELAQRACAEDSHKVREKVLGIADILVMLYRKKLVKINHSALELVCGRGLILKGYDVKVEHRLDDVLVCDVFGTREDGQLIVEIETGFIPPEAALEPSSYAKSRIASKIARYSRFAGRFALGTTPSYVLDFPEFFVKPRRLRTAGEALKIKA